MSLLKYYQKLDDAVAYLFSSTINEKKFLKQFFKNKKITFVDIGTNEGGYLDFLNNFIKFKKVICFEPIKDLSDKILKKYSKLNLLNFNFAVSNKDQIKTFYLYDIS